MAYIGDPGGDNVLEMLRAFVQLSEVTRRKRAEQAKELIGTKRSGATVEEVGLDKKQQKALYGRELAPGSVVSPESVQDRQAKIVLSAIDRMTPEQVDVLAGSFISREAGVPQVVGTAGLTSQGKAADTKAKLGEAIAAKSLGWVLEGLEDLDALPKKEKASLGAKLGVGVSAEEVIGGLAGDRIRSEINRTALKILADPAHPLNTVMEKNLGFNAIAAAGGVAIGLNGLMDTTARIANEKISTSKAMDLEMLRAALDMDKQLNQAEANWAQEVAKNFGGTITPRAIINWKRWREGGGDPKKMPRGISQEIDETLSAGTAISLRAFITEAAEKGDPQAKTMMQIAQGMQRITNANQLKAFGDLLASYYGMVQANSSLGPRPDPKEDPAGAQQWDQAAKALSQRIPKIDPKWWGTGGGVDLVQPPGTFQNPNPAGRYNFQAPAAPGTTGAPGAGATAPTLSLPGGQSLPAPALKPEDLANVQALLRLLPPSSLTPRP